MRLLFLTAVFLSLGAAFRWQNLYRQSGDALFMPFGYGAAVVLSGSMEPVLSVDDLVIVKKAEEYAVGDIVVYETEGMLVVHRIMEIEDGQIRTQGDANNMPDEPVDIGSVKGKLAAAIPGAGKLVRAIRTPAGGLGVLLAAVMLFGMSFRKEIPEADPADTVGGRDL